VNLSVGSRSGRAGFVSRVGGRKALSETDPKLLVDLERLVDEDRRGDPESLLLWASNSVQHLAGGLRELGHQIEYVTVAKLLRSLGYSLQANVKTREGRQHPDRDLQLRRINTVARQALQDHQPIISIDCLVGSARGAWAARHVLARLAWFPPAATSNRACDSPAHGSPTFFTAGIRLPDATAGSVVARGWFRRG
jgi:hypothetical protein